METLQIVTVSNDYYAKHTAVLLTSLFENKKSRNPINIYVIGSISKRNQSKLNKSVERFGITIKFFDVDHSLFKNLTLTHHFKQEIYYRLQIPKLLKPTIKKAIYLDSDIIVRDDITKLWNINIDSYFLAASSKTYLKGRQSELSIPRNDGCFNTGVMIINLSKWRKNNVSDLVMAYLKNPKTRLILPDQDAINVVLHDKFLNLDMKWNLTTADLIELKNTKRRMNPSIIHFTGKNKPWNSIGHKYQNEYFKYLNKTIWK